MSDQEVYESIRRGKDDALKYIYDTCRDEFIQWSRKSFGIAADESKDIFQNCCVILTLNIRNGQYELAEASIKSYMYGIAKNIIKQRDNNEYLSIDDYYYTLSEQPEEEEKEMLSLLKEAYRKLGEPCKSLLKAFYFQRCSLFSIAEDLGYKNEDSVKASKHRCLKKLKDQLNKR